jgi:hypothetical protein
MGEKNGASSGLRVKALGAKALGGGILSRLARRQREPDPLETARRKLRGLFT